MTTTAINSRAEPSNRTITSRRTRLISRDTETATTVNNEYRYGQYFFYAQEYKNNPHFVQSKFANMEEEMIQNELYSISTKQWNQNKTSSQLFLDRMKRECAVHHLNRSQCFERFGVHLKARHHPHYNRRYNIRSGQEIQLQHVLALKLFFNDGALSSAIRKTYWSLHESDHLDDIKARHTNFVHICQRLLEAIYLFGNPLPKEKHIYRGVTQQKFASFDAAWSGPVSTSFDFKVARRFTGTTGSVVKLESTEMSEMYIYGGEPHEQGAEYSLSNFDEKECLMWAPCLSIMDVPFCRNRRQYDIQQYISAMRLFQKVVSGHLFSRNEKRLLWSDAIQNKLHALIEWKVTGKDEKMMQCVQQDAMQRMQSPGSGTEDEADSVDSSRSLQRSSFQQETQDEKEALQSPELKERVAGRFIKSLCGTVFEHLLNTNKLFWVNAQSKLDPSLDQSIQKLLDSNRDVARQPCHVLEWRVSVDELRNAPYLNEDYLVINGYIREQIGGDTNMVNALVRCDEIMDYIGRNCKDMRAALDFKVDWKCAVQYGDATCVLNPALVILPSSFRANNEFYNMEIQFEGDITEIPGHEHLMWSLDVLCDQLNLSTHFVDQNVVWNRNRRLCKIEGFSNRRIQQFVAANEDVVWKIAFRFHYSNPEAQASPPKAQGTQSIDSRLYMKRKIENWLRSKMMQSATRRDDRSHKRNHMTSPYADSDGNGRNDRTSSNTNNNKTNESDGRNNEDHIDKGGNDGRGGSRSSDRNDDDDKDGNDEDDNAMEDEDDDADEEETNEKELDRFFKLFTNIHQLDDDALMKELHSFSNVTKMRDDMSQNIKLLNTGLIRLNNALHQCSDLSVLSSCTPPKLPEAKPVKAILCTTSKQNMCYQHRAYIPLKTKSKYKFNRTFTKQTIPQKTLEPLNGGGAAIYDFMVKMLGVNKNRYQYFRQNGAMRVFNVGLHSKETKQETYLIAQRLKSSRYYQWDVTEILTKDEIIEKYKVPSLPVPVQIEGIRASEMKEVREKIMKLRDEMIEKTNWTKIPIYNNKKDKSRNVRRMTLSLDKLKFIQYCKQFVHRHKGDLQLVPIVMFDANDAYCVEYVWIVSLEPNVDIGVSFEYNKAEDHVKVVGIYVDRDVIFKQHQIAYPSHTYSLLEDFTSEITDLYIGNPDDDRNRMNALKDNIEKLKRHCSDL